MTDPPRIVEGANEGTADAITPQQCTRCIHLRDRLLWKCDAFPDGIPAMILTNQHDHRKWYPRDHGIRFEPVDEETE